MPGAHRRTAEQAPLAVDGPEPAIETDDGSDHGHDCGSHYHGWVVPACSLCCSLYDASCGCLRHSSPCSHGHVCHIHGRHPHASTLHHRRVLYPEATALCCCSAHPHRQYPTGPFPLFSPLLDISLSTPHLVPRVHLPVYVLNLESLWKLFLV